jgi:flagellar biosynthesis protein FliR
MEIDLSEAQLSAHLLVLVRATAWLFIMPPFGGRTIPIQVKLGFAAALSLAIGPQVAEHSVSLDVAPLAGAVVMQVGIGVALGYIGVMAFGVVQAAGALIDSFSGLNMSQLVDPTSTGTTSVFGRFYQVLATTLLFTLGGHLMIVRGFIASFEATSLTHIDMERLAEILTVDIGRFLVAGLEIAAPLVAALLLTEIALGLLSRAAPAMNVFMLGMPIKVLVTIGLAAVAVPLIPGAVDALIEPMVRDGMRVVGG